MESFLQRYRNLVALVLVLAVQVVILAAQIKRPADPSRPQGQQVGLLRMWVATVITPVEKIFVNSGSSVRGAWGNYVNLRGLRKQNRDLQAEVDRLRLERAQLSDEAQQAHRLQALLGFKERYIDQTVAAEVIGTSGVETSRVIYIDKGERDGIKPDMPVITPDGIVGKIKEVYRSSSQVLEITDATSGAGVVLQSSRLRGVLKGGTGGDPEIVNIMNDENVTVGDQVVTSGGDSIFPPGLPVGTVERVTQDKDSSFFFAVEIKPAVSLSRLEEVLVVTKVEARAPQSQELASNDERVAGKLAERLPGIDANSQSTVSDEVPTSPKPPLQPIHLDRFSPAGAVISAQTATKGKIVEAGARPSATPVKKPRKPAATPAPQNTAGEQTQTQETNTAPALPTENKESNTTPAQPVENHESNPAPPADHSNHSNSDQGAPPQ